jgi:outer membrane biosynthesis protein TonB
LTLCFTESTRKGEKLSGKMEIEVTITADGSVSNVEIATTDFKKTVMASCTVRRVKNWKFPRFNGEPVVVVLPYILQSVY